MKSQGALGAVRVGRIVHLAGTRWAEFTGDAIVAECSGLALGAFYGALQSDSIPFTRSAGRHLRVLETLRQTRQTRGACGTVIVLTSHATENTDTSLKIP